MSMLSLLIPMKRLSIITLALFFLVPTSVFAAKDTFSKRYKNKTVKEVLADLKETTGTRVSYKRKEVNNTRRVTVSFHNAISLARRLSLAESSLKRFASLL